MRFHSFLYLLTTLALAACGSHRGGDLPPLDSGTSHDGSGGDSGGHDSGTPTDMGPLPDFGPSCAGGTCYTVYAHSDHFLYSIDLASRMLVPVGPFNAPMVGSSEDVITDLAVAPDDTIYVISHASIYTASATDGHVTRIGPITNCGTAGVALTFTPDGTLYTGDFMGAFCRIDTTTSPPTVTPIATLSGGFALAGDLVAVADGTMYGTVYRLSDGAGTGTQVNNLLARIDPASGTVTMIGATGFPKLFGVAYQMGEVFGFTHDGSGDVITIDPHTGVGTLYGTFMDPATSRGISFAGAGVNAMVPGLI